MPTRRLAAVLSQLRWQLRPAAAAAQPHDGSPDGLAGGGKKTRKPL